MEIDIAYAHTLTNMSQLLTYLTSVLGEELYTDKKRLVGLISDLYQGEERKKRVYKRAVLEDNLSLLVYELLSKGPNTWRAQIGSITQRYTENYCCPIKILRQVEN